MENEKEMKQKYAGGWSANNGSSYNQGYTDNNLRRLRKLLITICKGNVHPGNTASWSIYVLDGNGNTDIIAEGLVRK